MPCATGDDIHQRGDALLRGRPGGQAELVEGRAAPLRDRRGGGCSCLGNDVVASLTVARLAGELRYVALASVRKHELVAERTQLPGDLPLTDAGVGREACEVVRVGDRQEVLRPLLAGLPCAEGEIIDPEGERQLGGAVRRAIPSRRLLGRGEQAVELAAGGAECGLACGVRLVPAGTDGGLVRRDAFRGSLAGGEQAGRIGGPSGVRHRGRGDQGEGDGTGDAGHWSLRLAEAGRGYA